MTNIVIFGPPGAGKGTQAATLATRHGFQHVSTGALLRAEIDRGSSLGLAIEAMMASGQLVPDQVVTDLISALPRTGLILDGYPRTSTQARSLMAKMEIDHIWELVISDELLIDRIAGRFSCRACGSVYHDRAAVPPNGVCCGAGWTRRPDDREDVLRERLARYHSNVADAIALFTDHPGYRQIDAALPIGEISQIIDDLLR